MKKNIYFYTNLLAWGLVFLLMGNYAFGWVTPTANPPEGDLSAPLDISSTEQTKAGNLIIDSLFKVGRYSSAPTGVTGALYYDTTDNEFKGYKASSWDSLGGGGEDTDTWITTQTCSTDYALQSVGKESKTCINKVDYSDVAYDVSCTNCLTSTEVASADVASDLSCTDCIGTTEIADSYVYNTSDTMSGTLTVGSTLTVNGAITSPEGTLRDDAGGWMRTYGATGWYSQSYGGGWYMTDTTYIRNYGSKQVLLSNVLHMNSNKITNLGTPTVSTDAATKGDVDQSAGGGGCYTNWNGSTCYSGWTAVVTGHAAVGTYETAMPTTFSMTDAQCVPGTFSTADIMKGYWVYYGKYTPFDNTCAICCK